MEQTELFYKRETSFVLSTSSISEYVLKMSKRLDEETRRVYHYLNTSTKPRLIKLCVRVMVEDRLKEIFSDMDHWFEQESFQGNKIDHLLTTRFTTIV